MMNAFCLRQPGPRERHRSRLAGRTRHCPGVALTINQHVANNGRFPCMAQVTKLLELSSCRDLSSPDHDASETMLHRK
jgi:hypothetical protein